MVTADRLADQLDWLSLACDPWIGAPDGLELAGAEIVKRAAAECCACGAADDVSAFFAFLVAGLRRHLASVDCELDVAAGAPAAADCVPAAWWLAMLVLAVASDRPMTRAGAPRIAVSLQPITTKWQIMVTEDGDTLARAAARLATAVNQIGERVSGAHGCQGGRWGSLVYLRFAAKTHAPAL
ncbi:MAG: hypothetical protein H7Y61_10955 [Rhizobiales bacterium]|nr:hypothetical protein [Rhizobacter sp.]